MQLPSFPANFALEKAVHLPIPLVAGSADVNTGAQMEHFLVCIDSHVHNPVNGSKTVLHVVLYSALSCILTGL